MKVTVIGAGNIGMATCAYLASLDCEFTLYTRDESKAKKLNAEGLSSEGRIIGHYNINVTSNYQEALIDAEYIFITTLANNHLDVFKAIKPYLRKGQRIIIFNGNWGAFEAKEYYKEFLAENEIIIGETGAMLLMANVPEIGKVHVLGIKNQITISTINPNDVEIMISDLKDIIPQFRKSDSIYETSLSSTNPVIHVPISLFNLVRIEEGHDFSFYGEGVSKSAVRYIEAIDRERVSLAKKLGIHCPSILQSINSFFDIKHDNLYDALNKNETYIKGKAPKSINHRYFSEDIPYGIVPIIKLGKLLGVDTNYSEQIVRFAELALDVNYLETGVHITKEAIL